MINKYRKCLILLISLTFAIISTGCKSENKEPITIKNDTNVQVSGAMKKVMRQGELEGTIFLDTIQPKNNLYGIGPLELLKGELLIIDGESFVSKVVNDSMMSVQKTYDVKAPFFVYATVMGWEKEALPENISNIENLETYINEKFIDRDEPFVFKISGKINTATIHIVNLPEGTKVSSPEEAHQGIVFYPIQQEEVEIVGFFSRKHQAIFTHHDTFIHLHLITKDRKMMGHLDEVDFGSNQLSIYWSK
jgi:acetolactate decarboxylase